MSRSASLNGSFFFLDDLIFNQDYSAYDGWGIPDFLPEP
jgi:hypothetical protein